MKTGPTPGPLQQCGPACPASWALPCYGGRPTHTGCRPHAPRSCTGMQQVSYSASIAGQEPHNHTAVQHINAIRVLNIGSGMQPVQYHMLLQYGRSSRCNTIHRAHTPAKEEQTDQFLILTHYSGRPSSTPKTVCAGWGLRHKRMRMAVKAP